MAGLNIVITEKAKKKDLIALLSFLDCQYTEEGMLLHVMGGTKEQYEATQNEFMTKNALIEETL